MIKSAIYSFTMQIWYFILRFAFVPWYISVLGFEAYSVVLIFTLIQTWFLILDYALTPVFSLEYSRYREKLISYSEIRSFVRTIELIFLFIGFALFCFAYFFSDLFVATVFSDSDRDVQDTLHHVFVLICVVIVLHLIESIYHSALIGAELQVNLNKFNIAMHTFRASGALVVISIISPSLEVFFLWQALCSIVTILSLSSYFYIKVVGLDKWHYEFIQGLKKIFKGFRITLIGSFLVIMVQQVDKWFILGAVSSYEYGALVLAGTLAAALNVFAYAFLNVMYPRITLYYTRNEYAMVKHYVSLSLVYLAIFATLLICVTNIFGKFILDAWLGDPELSLVVFEMLKIVILLSVPLFVFIFLQPIYFLFNFGHIFLLIFASCILLSVTLFPWMFSFIGIIGPVTILSIVTGGGSIFTIVYLLRALKEYEIDQNVGRSIAISCLITALPFIGYVNLARKLDPQVLNPLMSCVLLISIASCMGLFSLQTTRSWFIDRLKRGIKWQ